MKSRRGGLLQFVLVVALLAAGAVAVGLLDQPNARLSGPARASDGDTITIDGERIRLVGIDAPELDQTCGAAKGTPWACGKAAREHLAGLVSAVEVTCASEGRDKYRRVLGRCRAGEADLGAAMIEAGLAVSYGDYKVRETLARAAHRGVWAGDFVMPQEWRRTRGEPEQSDLLGWLLDLLH